MCATLNFLCDVHFFFDVWYYTPYVKLYFSHEFFLRSPFPFLYGFFYLNTFSLCLFVLKSIEKKTALGLHSWSNKKILDKVNQHLQKVA